MASASSNVTRKNFIGYDGFVWWIGIVEDRNDPLNCGRCKVRIKGLHSSQNTSVSSKELPWAQPLFPTNNSFSTPSTLKEGDMVMGFFMDGPSAQYPIILGMFHGIPEDEPDNQSGFNDQRTEEELKASPRKVKSIEYKDDGSGAVITEADSAALYPYRLNEPTISRISRNEKIDETIVKTKKDSVVTVPDTTDEGSWTEPQTKYAAKCPYNQAVSSESGHYFEIDDTPGAERLHLYPRTGTFTEFHPDGTKVDRIVKDQYTVVMKDDHLYVMGDVKITVQGNAQVYVKKDCSLKVDGNWDSKVKGNWTVKVQGNAQFDINGNLDFGINGNWDTDIGGSVGHTSSGDTTIKASTIKLN